LAGSLKGLFLRVLVFEGIGNGLKRFLAKTSLLSDAAKVSQFCSQDFSFFWSTDV